MLIDPPSGWLYGFPKRYSPNRNVELHDWLEANGYPRSELWLWEKQGRCIPCRLISEATDEL